MTVAGLPAAAVPTANTHSTSQPCISDPPNVIGRGKHVLPWYILYKSKVK